MFTNSESSPVIAPSVMGFDQSGYSPIIRFRWFHVNILRAGWTNSGQLFWTRNQMMICKASRTGRDVEKWRMSWWCYGTLWWVFRTTLCLCVLPAGHWDVLWLWWRGVCGFWWLVFVLSHWQNSRYWTRWGTHTHTYTHTHCFQRWGHPNVFLSPVGCKETAGSFWLLEQTALSLWWRADKKTNPSKIHPC